MPDGNNVALELSENKMAFVKPAVESFDRRTFLKRAGFASAGVMGIGSLAGCTPSVDISVNRDNNSEPLPLSENPHIREVEEKYGIRLITARQAKMKLQGKKFDRLEEEEKGYDVPTKWDLKRLKLIDECLSKLPESFYRVDSDNEMLHIGLTDFDLGGQYLGDRERSGIRKGSDLIYLNYRDFHPEKRRESMQILTHELIHRKQGEDNNIYEYTNELRQVFQDRDFEEVAIETWNKVSELGWFDINFYLYNIFSDKTSYGVVWVDNDGQLDFRQNTTEFEASVGEIYLFGETLFRDYFGRIYSPRTARTLYRYMKRNFFDGVEYQQFPIEYPYQKDFEDEIKDRIGKFEE